MLTEETCFKLKTFGWPQCKSRFRYIAKDPDTGKQVDAADHPTVEELIDAMLIESGLSIAVQWQGGTYRVRTIHGNHDSYSQNIHECVAELWITLRGSNAFAN